MRINNKKNKSIESLEDVESKAISASKTILEACSELKDFSIDSLMTIIPKLIQHVEKYKTLKGDQKRSLVIKMLSHIIDETDGPGNDDLWDPVLKKLVPKLIDTLIEVNDGKLKLRKKKNGLLRCLTKLK